MSDPPIPSTPRPRAARVPALGLALAALALSGCGVSATSSTGQGSTSAAPPHAAPPTTASSTARSGPPPAPSAGPRGGGQDRGALAYSTASAQTVQPQPAPGSCHATGSGLYSRPDPRCTPGALNPAVTQANIGQTICADGWTDTVRPPESVTESEKAASLAAYGDTGPMSAYEYDHFVPLELGGAVNDARNLWPEPGASPNPKDAVEDELREKVCHGQMTLAEAQRTITANWVALAAPAGPAPGPSAPRCALTASRDSRYGDYDVYVHSDQPEQTVTVSDAAGRVATWHTDASGYADVYFHAPVDAEGETVTARVGAASCQTTL